MRVRNLPPINKNLKNSLTNLENLVNLASIFNKVLPTLKSSGLILKENRKKTIIQKKYEQYPNCKSSRTSKPN